MPIIQKQNAVFRADLLTSSIGGKAIPAKFFRIDEDGNAVVPGPQSNTIIKAGFFGLTEDGSLHIAQKYLNEEHQPGLVVVSGEILLIDPNGHLLVPNRLIPSCRTIMARERGADHKLLIKTHGGIGDVVCSEPAIRFALSRFPRTEKIYLCTDYPEFFQHLKFEGIFPASGSHQPKYSDFLLYQNFTQGDELAWEFAAHALMNAVDYASLNMWRCILPNAQKEIQLYVTDSQRDSLLEKIPFPILEKPLVAVHPGKTWDSRTFPKKFWDATLAALRAAGITPILIGGVVDNGRASTVDVDITGCLDLRSKLSWTDTVALLQECRVLLSNDSCPIHIAASGEAYIGFISTVKHPDLIKHWRNGEFGWRTENFSKGNLYETINFCPNQEKEVHVDKVDLQELLKWLPKPEEWAEWAIEKAM